MSYGLIFFYKCCPHLFVHVCVACMRGFQLVWCFREDPCVWTVFVCGFKCIYRLCVSGCVVSVYAFRKSVCVWVCVYVVWLECVCVCVCVCVCIYLERVCVVGVECLCVCVWTVTAIHRCWAGQVSCVDWFQAEMQPGSEPGSGFMEHLGFSVVDLSRHLSDEKPGSNVRERETIKETHVLPVAVAPSSCTCWGRATRCPLAEEHERQSWCSIVILEEIKTSQLASFTNTDTKFCFPVYMCRKPTALSTPGLVMQLIRKFMSVGFRIINPFWLLMLLALLVIVLSCLGNAQTITQTPTFTALGCIH